ncbi:MAG: hypothetical protein WD396_09690 [Pseudohongiellaceae bacterium]
MILISLAVAFSVGLSLLVSVVAGFGLFILSFNAYPLSALILLPALLGLLGTIGLYLAWSGEQQPKSARRLHTEIALLVAGELGALALLAMYYGWFLAGIQQTGLFITVLYLALPIMLLGAGLIVRAALALRQRPACGWQAWQPAGLVLVACVGLLLLRIGGQEAVMAWYGRGLVSAAYASAEEIAGDSSYCVIDRDGARSFEELDRRRLLLEAVEKRLGFTGMNQPPVSAHFGIAVDGRAYWWSFRQRQFLPFSRGYYSYLQTRDCPYDY